MCAFLSFFPGESLRCFCLGDENFLEDESTKNYAQKVADHYSARSNQTLEEREASPIIHLKKLNNWVCEYSVVYDFVVTSVT
jgi:hypothetical protein